MTAIERLNANISRYVSFTEAELEIFDALATYKEFPKKVHLLREGEVCNFEAFVVSGCLRKYYIDSNGFEVILQFAVEDAWVGDVSFDMFDKKPSHVFIETLEPCQLLTFTPEDKELLFERAPRFERAFRILVQRNLAVTQNRLFNTISKTATEKYMEFMEQYPTIPQRVPQHYIASYLGISPEFLSKIRSKMAHK